MESSVSGGGLRAARHARARRSFGELAGAALIGLAGPAAAVPQSPGVLQEQLLRAQQQEQDRQQRQSEPVVRLLGDGGQGASGLPPESPCYTLETVVLALPPGLSPAVQRAGARALSNDLWAREGVWVELQRLLQAYRGRCVGTQGINLIVHQAAAWLIDQGYATSRVGLVEGQDLAQGHLALTVIPGVLGEIRVDGDGESSGWRNAFPIRSGDLLDLRALEQGLEQMKRVPSQDVTMQIVPGSDLGVSDVVLTVQRNRPVRLGSSLNDAGQPATGTCMASVNLAFDNLMGWSDILSTSYTQNVLDDNRLAGNDVTSWYYAVPWGYAMWSVSQTRNYYRLTTGPRQLLRSRGDSTTQDVRMDYVVQRDEAQKSTMYLRLASYQSHAFVNDVEVVGQRENRMAEWGWLHKHYLGTAQLDSQISQRFGLPGFGGQPDYALADAGGPTFFYEIESVDLALTVPWQWGGTHVRYSGTFHAQSSPNVLYATEYLSIGSRYNVRGFNGVTTLLSAESGAWLRNEIELRPQGSEQALYLGLDAGKVYGPATAQLPGTQLAGAVVGLRGTPAPGHHYDFFVATALQQPASFKADSPVFGAMWTWEAR